jgi:hypothetical protein
MKINILKTVALASFLAACASSHAVTIFLTTDALGRVQNGVAADAPTDVAMVNSIVDRANGSATSSFDIAGKTYTTAGFFNPANTLPYSTFVSTSAVGGDNIVDVGVGGFTYLTVKYDGANGSELVFYIAGLTGGITVPGSDLDFGANQYSLFNAVGGPGTPPGVPDGGTSVVLLGLALGALALVRRHIA